MNAPTYLAIALGIGGLVACGAATPTATPAPTSTTTAPGPTVTPPPTSDGGPGPMTMLVDGGGPTTADASTILPSWKSSISFSNITGRTGDQTAAIFMPTAPAIEGCRGASGGKLVLRLRADGGHLVAEPQAGSSVDPSARQCVLDALSKVHLEDASNVGANAPVKAMGFTSLLTIEW